MKENSVPGVKKGLREDWGREQKEGIKIEPGVKSSPKSVKLGLRTTKEIQEGAGIPKGTLRTEMLALDLWRDDGREIYGLVHVRLLINSIFLHHTNN